MLRYKRLLPYLSVISLAIVLLLARFPVVSSLKKPTVDGSKIFLKILNYPFQELKKILFYHSAYNQNLALREESAQLKNKLVELEELRQENDRLKKLFNFKHDSNFTLIVSQVIGRDSVNWLASLIIDKGKENGVQNGMCVITDAGLVGKIVEVGSFYSKVMLINDPNSSVSSLIQRSREQGITSGTVTGELRLHFLPVNSDVKVGDLAITSGLGGVYPKGLVVGKVTEVGEEADGLSKSCLLVPAVKLSRLEEVLIMVR